MLENLDVDPTIVERVCWLIAHHHTYIDIQGIDYQILVEADFLVNAYEDNMSIDAIRKIDNNIFRTRTGKKFLNTMFEVNLKSHLL